MCYVCNCFGWALDMLQRLITFMLACVLMFVVCSGMLIAIAAGIAYGYNYSMAEFLTFTRQRTTVYMRRGQFYDQPDTDPDDHARSALRIRSPGPAPWDLAYQEMNLRTDAQALPSAWNKLKDTQNYAKVLNKYSQSGLKDIIPLDKEKTVLPEDARDTEQLPKSLLRSPVMQYPSTNTPSMETPSFESHAFSPPVIPVSPIHQLPVQTALLGIGTTQTIMRRLLPLSPDTYPVTTTTTVQDLQSVQYGDYLPAEHVRGRGDINNRILMPSDAIILDDAPENRPYIPIRERPPHDYPEDIDENEIVYRPTLL